jgi:PERQ amino acid-rich with GYF domain-containing protein
MSAEERDMFATDVNSTLKPPQQNKDGNHQGASGVNGRKTSVSVGSAANYQTSSPSAASRPGTRRRETTDTNPFPTGPSTASPTASRFVRDESWLPRRSTELKETTISDEPEEVAGAREAGPPKSQPFGLPRSNTMGTSGFGAASSLWGSGPASTGATGAFGSFALPTPATGDKRFGTAAGSRLAHLIPKDKESADGGAAAAKPSDAPSWRPRQRTDTDPFAADDGPSGSAALRGEGDNSPPATAQNQRGGVLETPVKGGAGDFGMAGLSLGGHGPGDGPASPSETNPFRSPPGDRADEGHEHDANRLGHSAASSEQQSNFSSLTRSLGGGAFDGSDRSQTSSVGTKGFPSVPPLSGWPAGPSVGTPDRERAPFPGALGGGIFSPLADLPSPGLGGLGGVFGPPGGSRLGRGKLESLFPPAMQAQMHGHDQESLADSLPDVRHVNPLGAIGRSTVGLQPRDADSPARATRGPLEDLFPAAPESRRSPFSTGELGQSAPGAPAPPQSFPTLGSYPSMPSAADPMARSLVLPDRMRWLYLDPQGAVQGPFSGLEMHDWFKGGFFNNNLHVKRLEDDKFEPLGEVIRRIGNSREPFLVPQIGIPHGPPPATGRLGAGSTEAVPPLQGAFPSFGRTLTAQQQNELERRKQEEQMFHARQRELAQHHHGPFGALPPIRPGAPGALHHHSSAHSLQSQPSFGNMASPVGMTPQLLLGPGAPTQAFFDGAAPPLAPGPAQPPIGPAGDVFAADLNPGERQILADLEAAASLPGGYPGPQAPGGGVGGGSTGLRAQLPSVDQLQRDPEGFHARLQEFEKLRAQFDAEQAMRGSGAPETKHDGAGKSGVADFAPMEPPKDATTGPMTPAETKSQGQQQAELTLTEKVRKTQADNAKSAQSAAPASDLPMPFPPPAQATPLAAPTAQRPASNLPARFGERSAAGTPDTTSDAAALAPPPTAPWAPQPGAEVPKGPSLKEIQEAEAKKAAKKEEAAAAARRAALEQEAAAMREREKAAAAAANPLLPPTSTWGTGSPVGGSSGSPWKQPAALKGGAVGAGPANSGSKKTLAEIQREEEARKQKAKEAAAAQAGTVPAPAMGKRYADLAGKATANPPGLSGSGPAAQTVQAGGGWSTVGAGGKVKVPTGPAVQSRAASASNIKPAPTPAAAKAAAPKPVQTTLKDAKNVAMEEFKKWLHRELARGLVGVNDSEFFAVLCSFSLTR